MRKLNDSELLIIGSIGYLLEDDPDRYEKVKSKLMEIDGLVEQIQEYTSRFIKENGDVNISDFMQLAEDTVFTVVEGTLHKEG